MTKILIVDDEEDLIKVISVSLELEDFTILKAKDGVEALKVFEAERPDIILSDIRMPLMNGIELCENIRKNFEVLPRFFLMSGNFNQNLDELQYLQIEYLFTKPFDIDELIKRVQKTP